MLAHPFSSPAKGIRGTQKGPACAGPFQQSQYNLANVHNLLLRTDADHKCSAASQVHREVCSISLTAIHHTALQIQQVHLRTDLCARNLKLTAIHGSRELRSMGNYRDSVRIELRPLAVLADKHLLKFGNVVCHVFALGSAVRQIFFRFDRFNDNFDGAGGFSLRT